MSSGRSSQADLLQEVRELRSRLAAVHNREIEWARIEEALRESETRYRSLYHNTPVMMHSIDEQGRLTDVNDYWLTVMGYERDGVLGRPLTDFLTDDAARRAVEISISALRQHGVVRDVKSQLVTRQGEVIDVLVSAIAEFDQQGRFNRSLAFLVDVTARNRAETALRASEERFSKIFNLSNDAGFVLDPAADTIVDANQRAAALLGYGHRELLTLPISAIHPDEMPRLTRFTNAVFEQGGGWTDELSCVTKAGERISAEISASAVEIGGERRIVAWVRDISDRKKAEEALRESEERFRLLVDRAADAFYVLDPDGTIVDVNQQACETTGYTREELLALAVWEISEGLSAAQLRHNVEQMTAAGPVTMGGYHRRKDGTTFPVEVRAGLFVVRGKQRILALARDITERLQAERVRRRLEGRLSRILDSAMDAIMTFDQSRRITLFNKAAERVFLCPAREAIGTAVDRFLSDEVRRLLSEEQPSGEAGARWLPPGQEARRSSGESFPIEATVSCTTVDGEVLYTMILRDIDQRQRAEAELRKLSLERIYLQEEIETEHNFGELVGTSSAITGVVHLIEQVAATDSTVLITGETGTGKELVARAIHGASARGDRVLIKVNCAALAAGLIESELFGHEKGAFTGAVARRSGRFELADRATIFLDEIGDLPPELQAKLLRVLQEGEFERVGGTRTIRVDVRVIAATNRDLEDAVEAGRFRSDLYYRLRVFPIHVPPLRERREDIPLLVSFFARRYAQRLGKEIDTVPQRTLHALAQYAWPGNIRELENVVERAVILSTGRELDLETWLRQSGGATYRDDRLSTLDDAMRAHILEALERTGWRVSGPKGAAQILGIKPTTLQARMKKLGIQRPD